MAAESADAEPGQCDANKFRGCLAKYNTAIGFSGKSIEDFATFLNQQYEKNPKFINTLCS